MTIEEAINRGNNLTATAILTISGLAFLPEVFVEDEWWHKLDDLLIFLIGLGAVAWYKRGQNRFSVSRLPLLLVIVALAGKITGLILEWGDMADLGDDFGALILFLAATILIWRLKYNAGNGMENRNGTTVS